MLTFPDFCKSPKTFLLREIFPSWIGLIESIVPGTFYVAHLSMYVEQLILLNIIFFNDYHLPMVVFPF